MRDQPNKVQAIGLDPIEKTSCGFESRVPHHPMIGSSPVIGTISDIINKIKNEISARYYKSLEQPTLIPSDAAEERAKVKCVICRNGEIGRRARLKSGCRKTCGSESHFRYHVSWESMIHGVSHLGETVSWRKKISRNCPQLDQSTNDQWRTCRPSIHKQWLFT